MSIKYNVFDLKNVSMDELLRAMEVNFEGYDQLRHDLIYETPKYGNDDDYADILLLKFLIFFMMQ